MKMSPREAADIITAHFEVVGYVNHEVDVARQMVCCAGYLYEDDKEKIRKLEEENRLLKSYLLQTGCLFEPSGNFFLENVPKMVKKLVDDIKKLKDNING